VWTTDRTAARPLSTVGVVPSDVTLDASRVPADVAGEVSDAELAACALAADPEAKVDDDAVCLWDVCGGPAPNRLPAWYMPAPSGGRVRSGWRRTVILLIVVSFIAINAAGLCSTYGRVAFGG
jgi:hypothetical protein